MLVPKSEWIARVIITVFLILLAAVSAEVLGGETPNRGRLLLPALAAVAAAIRILTMALPAPRSGDLLDFYIGASPELIRCLNEPSRDPERALLPYSYFKLIEHFRTSGRGDIAGAPPLRPGTSAHVAAKP